MATAKPIVSRKRVAIWKRGGLTYRQLAMAVMRGSTEHDLLGRASGLAFDFLFALFPLLLFLLSLFGLFASHGSQLQSSLLSFFSDLLPSQAFQILNRGVSELAQNSTGGILTIGFILALWFASSGVSSMISTLNVVYQVQETRSWLKVRAIASALTLGISILLLLALFMVLVSGSLADRLGQEAHIGAVVVLAWKASRWPAAAVFVALSYSLIYYFGPALQKSQKRWVTPGAAFSAVLWLVAATGFRVYLHFFDTYSATFGSLGAVMILMAWLYVTGLAFLVGGEINAQIERAAIQ
jgi:membrane protein